MIWLGIGFLAAITIYAGVAYLLGYTVEFEREMDDD